MPMNDTWMRGRCWDLACALNKQLGLPIYGVFDQADNCHHAFVFDVSLAVGVDARGILPIQRIAVGSQGSEIRPLSRGEIEDKWLGRPLDAAELREASKFAKQTGLTRRYFAYREVSEQGSKDLARDSGINVDDGSAKGMFDASLGRSVDGVKVTEAAGEYRIEFDYNPALVDRISRIGGAGFKRDEKVWTVDVNLKSFVARSVNEMRAEVAADRADRDQMIEAAAELIDSPKTRDALADDGKSYTGRVLAINDRYVLQHSGKDHVTLHRAGNLDDLPTVGENARISYKGGRAQSRDLSRDRAKSECLSR